MVNNSPVNSWKITCISFQLTKVRFTNSLNWNKWVNGLLKSEVSISLGLLKSSSKEKKVALAPAVFPSSLSLPKFKL